MSAKCPPPSLKQPRVVPRVLSHRACLILASSPSKGLDTDHLPLSNQPLDSFQGLGAASVCFTPALSSLCLQTPRSEMTHMSYSQEERKGGRQKDSKRTTHISPVLSGRRRGELRLVSFIRQEDVLKRFFSRQEKESDTAERRDHDEVLVDTAGGGEARKNQENSIDTYTCVCVLRPFNCVPIRDPMEPTSLLGQRRFSRQEHWSGLPCPPPRNLPNPGILSASSYVSCVGRRVLYPLSHLRRPDFYTRPSVETDSWWEAAP